MNQTTVVTTEQPLPGDSCDRCRELEQQLIKCGEMIAEAALEIELLRQRLEEQQRLNNGLRSQVSSQEKARRSRTMWD